MNKIKLLRNSSALAAIPLIGLGVTLGMPSCSTSLDALLKREINQSVYLGVYSYEVETWNPVITQTSQDITEILCLQEPLLYSDHFGDYQGGTAKDYQDGGWVFDPTGLALTVYLRDGLGSKNPGADPKPTDDIVPYRWTNVKGNFQSENPTIKSYADPNDPDAKIAPNGNEKGQVLPHHIYNSLRYALNPFNNAEGLYMWQCTSDVIGYVAEYIDFLVSQGTITNANQADVYIAKCLAGNVNDLPPPPTDASYTLSDFKPENIFEYNDGIKQSDGYYTGGWIKFHFSRPANGFAESLLGASPFCATPDIAINYEGASGGERYGMDPNFMWYDGPYLPSYLKPSFTRIFTFNNSWRTRFDDRGNVVERANEPTIKKIIKNYASQSGIGYTRHLFESGDITGTSIQTSDVHGWKKYVGDNMYNAKFQGANLLESPSLGSWGITANFFHKQITGENDNGRSTYGGKSYSEDEKQWKLDNYAMSLPSVRAFMTFLFNRSYVAHYYGELLDPKNYNPATTPSQSLRNNYTPIGLARADDKDYVSYVTDAAKESITNVNTTQGWSGEKFNPDTFSVNETQDALEGYRHDPYIGLSAWTDHDGATGIDAIVTGKDKYSTAVKEGNLPNQISALKEKINADFNYIFNTTDQTYNANLYWLQNGDFKNASGKPVADAIAQFNQDAGGINNTPVRIIPFNSIDSNDYKKLRNNNYFTYIISGWSPDFADPFNFLNLFMYDGYIAANYQHLSKVFQSSGDWNQGTGALSFTTNTGWDQAEFERAYTPLKDLVESYSNQIGVVATTPSSQMTEAKRFAEYAKLEYISNHLSAICQPLYVDPTKRVGLSYVDPDTLSYNADQTSYSSISTGRINNMHLNKTLLTHQEYQGRRFMNKYAAGQSYDSIEWNSLWGTKPTEEQCIQFKELEANQRTNYWLL